MYRLFERAQAILSNSKAEDSTTTARLLSGPNQAASNRNTSSQRFIDPHLPQQQSQDYEEPATLPTGSDLQTQEEPGALWFDELPQFGSIDQLLSPGFSLSENIFQDFFPGYDRGISYDTIVTLPAGMSDDPLYNV